MSAPASEFNVGRGSVLVADASGHILDSELDSNAADVLAATVELAVGKVGTV